VGIVVSDEVENWYSHYVNLQTDKMHSETKTRTLKDTQFTHLQKSPLLSTKIEEQEDILTTTLRKTSQFS
jgi:hypothetical protein